MKKLFSFIALGAIAIVPFSVKAATTSIDYSCSDKNAEGKVTCTVSVDSGSESINSLTVLLTEAGGADVVSVNDATPLWSNTKTENGNVNTITSTSSTGSTGKQDLFTFVYQTSGEADCGITISLGNTKYFTGAKDTPAENKQTGLSLPYVVLGSLALVAAGAYVSTKNKSKMFKI